MAKHNYSLEGMTLAVTHMQKMKTFYCNLFNIQFTQQNMFQTNLYSGKWGGLKLLLCPANVAQNTATQNRHQFDVLVDDIHEFIRLAKQHEGKIMGEIEERDNMLTVGIYDPDNNSLIIKQYK